MLRPLDDALNADPRYAAMMVETPTGWRPIAFPDHHAMVATVTLTTAAPDTIQRMFSRALHCTLYAWFDYELTSLAEQQALATLEAALRTHFGVQKGSLWNMVERASARGTFPASLGRVPLTEAIGNLRNDLAHGTDRVATPGMSMTLMAYIAELIGRLFPEASPVETA